MRTMAETIELHLAAETEQWVSDKENSARLWESVANYRIPIPPTPGWSRCQECGEHIHGAFVIACMPTGYRPLTWPAIRDTLRLLHPECFSMAATEDTGGE